MKNIQFNRFLATMLTLVMTSLLFTPVLAAAKYDTTDKKTVSKSSNSGARATLLQSIKAQDGQTEFSVEDLEQMRAALLELVDSNQELSSLLSAKGKERVREFGPQKDGDQFSEARKQIEAMSSQELTTIRKALDPSKMRSKLTTARVTLDEYKNSAMKVSADTGNRPGLPGIDSYCGAPVSTAAIIAADVIYFVAEGVRDAAQNACNQVAVAVILGEGGGGNGRLACNVTDIIYLAAKAVNQGIHFCDDDYAASVGQASFDRLGHIHDDIEDIKANDNTNYTNVIGDAATNTTKITTAVTTAKTAIVNNDNTNKDTITTAISTSQTAVIKAGDANSAAIINNDNTNKTTIVENDNTNKNTIVTNDNTNRVLLLADAKANKDFLLRTQIEADLSSTDGATFVALFLTPSNICFPVLDDKGVAQSGNTQCGYLDFARAIVVQTIANIGGLNKTQANSFLSTGDSYRTAGNYRQAYQNYRLAFKAAAGISIK